MAATPYLYQMSRFSYGIGLGLFGFWLTGFAGLFGGLIYFDVLPIPGWAAMAALGFCGLAFFFGCLALTQTLVVVIKGHTPMVSLDADYFTVSTPSGFKTKSNILETASIERIERVIYNPDSRTAKAVAWEAYLRDGSTVKLTYMSVILPLGDINAALQRFGIQADL